MKNIVIWMNIPSIHQNSFFRTLYEINKSVRIAYYMPENVLNERKSSDFVEDINSEYEYIINNLSDLELIIPDWKNSIHVVPGIGDSFSRKLIWLLLINKVCWVHWSEHYQVKKNWVYTIYPRIIYSLVLNLFADKVILQSTLGKKQFSRLGVLKRKIRVFHYNISNAMILKESDVVKNSNNSGGVKFLYLGRFTEVKGIERLLNACKRLSLDDESFTLELIGEDKSNGLYQEISKNLELDGHVHFKRSVSNTSIIKLISKYDALILPSNYDGWGVVVNESLSSGTPAIVSYRAGSSDLIKNGMNGFVFKNDDELYLSLKYFLNNPSHPMIGKCIESAHEASSEKVAKHFLNLLYN